MASNPNQITTGHFMFFWGVPNDIQVQDDVLGSPLAILEFAPREGQSSWRYATNGMGIHLQSCGGETTRTELYLQAERPCPWAIPLLAALVPYPIQQETHFAEYDTIAVAQPIDGRESKFTALLLVPPSEEEAALGIIDNAAPEPILVHQVVGIYESEVDLAIEQGGEELYRRLRLGSHSLSVDEPRPPVV